MAAEVPEDKYLQFAVALECLVLPERGDELSYRLSHRVARALGSTPETRVEIAKEVKDLYKLRSNIVHDGHLEISEGDVYMIQDFAIEVICRLLTDSEVQEFHKADELREYFEKRSLS